MLRFIHCAHGPVLAVLILRKTAPLAVPHMAFRHSAGRSCCRCFNLSRIQCRDNPHMEPLERPRFPVLLGPWRCPAARPCYRTTRKGRCGPHGGKMPTCLRYCRRACLRGGLPVLVGLGRRRSQRGRHVGARPRTRAAVAHNRIYPACFGGIYDGHARAAPNNRPWDSPPAKPPNHCMRPLLHRPFRLTFCVLHDPHDSWDQSVRRAPEMQEAASCTPTG